MLNDKLSSFKVNFRKLKKIITCAIICGGECNTCELNENLKIPDIDKKDRNSTHLILRTKQISITSFEPNIRENFSEYEIFIVLLKILKSYL